MGIGTSRGGFYDDEFQHQAGIPTLPKGDEEMVKKPVDTGDDNVLPPVEGSYDQPTAGLTKVYITKPDVHPEPDYMNPPEGNAIQSYVKGLEDDVKSIPDQPAKFMRDMEKSKQNNLPLDSPEGIDTAINVALGAGVGSISSKNAPYINMFLKQPETPKLIAKPTPLDSFESAYKNIVEALDGPGAYEKQMADIAAAKEAAGVKYTGDKVTIPITESGKKIDKGFAGWNESDLAQMSPKEASEKYWEFLTKHGDFTAGGFESKYVAAQKSNGGELFQEHVKKLHADNPYQQTPFEAPPGSYEPGSAMAGISTKWSPETSPTYKAMMENAPNTDYLDVAIAKKEALENKLSPLDKVNNKIEEIKGRIMKQMLHERAKIHMEAAAEKIPKEAIEAGYYTPAYRGLKNRDQINPEHDFNKNNVMYSSDNVLLADMYTDYLSHHPGWNPKQGAFSEGAAVAPLVIDTRNYHVYDAKGSDWSSANGKAIAEARAAGKPGVIVRNVYDEPNSTHTLGKPNTVYITLEHGASTVKSKFAKSFDPDSRNMLHMIPVIGVGGAAGYVSVVRDQE